MKVALENAWRKRGLMLGRANRIERAVDGHNYV